MLDLSSELEKLVILPDYVSSATLDPHWRRLLDLSDSNPGHDLEFAKCFHELAHRQWHTYSLPDADVQRRIAVWVTRVWNPDALNVIGKCIGIIGCLGLESCVGLVWSFVEDPATDSALASELANEVAGWGSPLDPWSGMAQS